MYTRFTTGMRARNQIQSNTPLTDDQIRQVAPSVFAEGAWDGVSDRYTFLPTSVTLEAMRKNGFEPFFVAETKPRKEEKQGFTKHMIRYRQVGDIASQGEVKEVIHINSHDRTSQDVLMGGFFRTACANGCFIGTLMEDIKVRHSGNVSDDIIEGAYTIINQFGKVDEALEIMKCKSLPAQAQESFARAATIMRYPDKEELPVEPRKVLFARRPDDTGSDVYTVYQRIQENLVRGGVTGVTGRVTRGLTGINEMTKLNKALFDLAHNIAKSL
jgi:hypothetical protein